MGGTEFNNRYKSSLLPIVNQLNVHFEKKHFPFLFGSLL